MRSVTERSIFIDAGANTQGASPLVFISALILMATSLLVGGVSRDDPLGWMVVELVSLAVLFLVLLNAPARRSGGMTIAGYGLLLAFVLIPLAQLVRLPPSWWHSLPGRGPLAHAILLAGLTNAWRPISLAPDETQRALLFLLAPAGMFTAATQCNERQLRWIAAVALIVALASLCVGALQVAGPSSGVRNFYNERYDGLPCGFFANRNHQASFLVCCVALTATLVEMNPVRRIVRDNPAIIFGLMFLFAVGTAATLSRAGILLLAPVVIGATLIHASQAGPQRARIGLIVFSITTLAAVGLIILLKGGSIWERFRVGDIGDLRVADFPQVFEVARSFLPLGSGVGSFDLVYRAHEPLEQVTQFYLNHAHDDYLEGFLEAGWPAAGILIAFGFWWAVLALRAWRSKPGPSYALPRAGSLVTGALLLHSIVDYPLRTPALAVIFAFACGLLLGKGNPVRRAVRHNVGKITTWALPNRSTSPQLAPSKPELRRFG